MAPAKGSQCRKRAGGGRGAILHKVPRGAGDRLAQAPGPGAGKVQQGLWALSVWGRLWRALSQASVGVRYSCKATPALEVV